MHHLHIDRFAGLSSPLHVLDARAKLVSTLCFILIVVLTPDGYFLSYAVYFFLLAAVILISHIPLLYILKRSLTLLPFVLVVSIFVPFITPGTPLKEFSVGPFEAAVTSEGILRFVSIGFKALISFFATITLVSSTRFGDLMRASGALGLPSILVIVLSFMYRYLFILVDEASHMILARNLRAYGRGGMSVLTASGGIVGALFVRSFEHAGRLYYAMLLRGYSGRPVTLTPMRLVKKDVLCTVFFLGVAVLGLAAGMMMNL